ncbi:DUF86 domain-containing protein [bacterium]
MNQILKTYMLDIIGSIEQIEILLEEYYFETFFKNLKIKSSVVRILEIIGEAANKIPIEFKNQFQEVPWSKISGMYSNSHNKYFDADTKEVWDISTIELPSLKLKFIKIFESLNL